MSVEELKLIMDAVSGVTENAALIAILYFVLNALTPVLKYTIVSVAIYKVIKTITSVIVVEKKDNNES